MKIIKLYLKYFFSISNVIIICCLISFLLLSYIISIVDINLDLTYKEVFTLYYENSCYYTKIIMILLSCFIFMKLSSERNEYIINIVVTAGYTKKNNFYYMVISHCLIIIVLNIISFVFFVGVGLLFIKNFIMDIKYIYAYCSMIVISLYYGLLSYFLNLLFNNQFIFIGLILLFFLSEIIVNIETAIKYIYLTIFPNINTITGKSYINLLYIIFFGILLFFINKLVYSHKDLKS